MVVPDLAVRVERMPELPDTAWFTVALDWVCEVPSRATIIAVVLPRLGSSAARDEADHMAAPPPGRSREFAIVHVGFGCARRCRWCPDAR